MFDKFRDSLSSTDGPTRYAARGGLFQIPMITLFLTLTVLYAEHAPPLLYIATLPGSFLFIYCLHQLYFRDYRLTRVVTDGPFRYTRHPMYLGLLIMSLTTLAPGPDGYTVVQVLMYLLFLATMGAAALFQEYETVARFGDEAAEYYEQTPRIPFLV